MSDKSAIQWCDATWNPIRGCVKVSPGCAHCYAETFAERFRGVKGHAYEQGFDLRLVPEKLDEPLRWKKPRRIFVNSMSDLFQDGVPDEYIDRVFAVMACAPQHIFQILTKRADRMHDYVVEMSKSSKRIEAAALTLGYSLRFHDISLCQWPLPNVWLGVSVENQHFAAERIPLLLKTPAAVRFISAEPLLEIIDLTRFLKSGLESWEEGHSESPDPKRAGGYSRKLRGLDWVIVGGESGYGARPFDLAWARSLIDQCRIAGVACFVKQLGKMPYEGTANPYTSGPEAINCRLYELDIDPYHGGDPTEWPADLRVREFPERANRLAAVK